MRGSAVGEKFWMLPGPCPVPVEVKMPKLEFTIRTEEMLLRKLLTVTRMLARPRGAFEGMMALICPGLKKTGIAATVADPWVMLIDTPARVVDKGKANAGEVAGPRLDPKMEN